MSKDFVVIILLREGTENSPEFFVLLTKKSGGFLRDDQGARAQRRAIRGEMGGDSRWTTTIITREMPLHARFDRLGTLGQALYSPANPGSPYVS